MVLQILSRHSRGKTNPRHPRQQWPIHKNHSTTHINKWKSPPRSIQAHKRLPQLKEKLHEVEKRSGKFHTTSQCLGSFQSDCSLHFYRVVWNHNAPRPPKKQPTNSTVEASWNIHTKGPVLSAHSRFLKCPKLLVGWPKCHMVPGAAKVEKAHLPTAVFEKTPCTEFHCGATFHVRPCISRPRAPGPLFGGSKRESWSIPKNNLLLTVNLALLGI